MSVRDSPPVETGSIVVAASALLVVVGTFLGWFTVPVGDTLGSIDGIELFLAASPLFNGVVTATIAAMVTMLALFLGREERVNVLTAIAGLVVELVAVAFVVAPDVALGPTIDAGTAVTLTNTGIGVYVTLVGGLGILLGSVLSYRD